MLLNEEINLLNKKYQASSIPDYKLKYKNIVISLLNDLYIKDFLYMEFYLNCDRIKRYISLDKQLSMSLYKYYLLYKTSNLKIDMEQSYNILNYVINSLYRYCANSSEDILNSKLFLEQINRNRELVKLQVNDIFMYLYNTMLNITNSRLSIGDINLLTSNLNKNILSNKQLYLMEAISIGCFKQELENRNYNGIKKLIYVPQCKIK